MSMDKKAQMPPWPPGIPRPPEAGSVTSKVPTVPGVPNIPAASPKAVPGLPTLPGDAPKGTAVKHPGSQWTGSAKAIAAMQQSIQKLVAEVFGSSIKDPAISQQKNQFNNFLSNQYDPVTNGPSLSDSLAIMKKLSVKTNMRTGIWDAKTQDALKHIASFAASFANLAQDFGGIPHGLSFAFTNRDVEQLKQLIDINVKNLSTDELMDHAHQVTDLINKLHNFYNYYYQSVTKQPSYRTYVTENKPLYTVKPSESDPNTILSQVKNWDDLYLTNVVVPSKVEASGRKQITKFPVSSMISLDNFKSFMKSYLGYTDQDLSQDPSLISRTLAAVKLNIQQNQPVKG